MRLAVLAGAAIVLAGPRLSRPGVRKCGLTYPFIGD
jgi:hypothetical protein